MNYPKNFNDVSLLTKNISKKFTKISSNKTNIVEYRQLSDTSTKIYSKIFVKPNMIELVNFIYNTVNSKILININNLLIDNKHDKLNNEHILLYLKGGNNFVILQDLFTDIFKEMKENSVPSSITDHVEISDNDFSINIITNSEARFNIIYHYVKILLTEALYDITNIFNNMYQNEYKLSKISIVDFNKIVTQSKKQHKITNNIAEFYINFYKTDDNKKEEINLITSNVIDNIDHCNDIYALTTLEYLNSLYSPYNPNLVIIDRITKLLYTLEVRFYNKFYSPNSINQFKTELANELNKFSPDLIFHNEFQNIDYCVNRKLIPSDIMISNNSNVLIHNTDSIKKPMGIKIINDNPFLNTGINNTHYITINSLIYNNLTTCGHNINFDLFRAKLNIITTLSNDPAISKINYSTDINNEIIKTLKPVRIKIPSEFIDVSVSKYDDFNLVLNTNSYYMDPDNFLREHMFEYIDNKHHFTLFNNKLIIRDLIEILFIQPTYAPYYVNKYKKRIVRLFYFYSLELFEVDNSKKKISDNLKLLSESLNKIIISMKTNLNESTVSTQNISNVSDEFQQNFYPWKLTCDVFVNVCKNILPYKIVKTNPEFENIQPLLNFILIYILILENDPTNITKVVEGYNLMYNIIATVKYEEIWLEFYRFLNECLKIINICINIFCESSPKTDDPVYQNIINFDNDSSLIKISDNDIITYTYIINNKPFTFLGSNKIYPQVKTTKCTPFLNSYTDEIECEELVKEKYNNILNDIVNISDKPIKDELIYHLNKLVTKRGLLN